MSNTTTDTQARVPDLLDPEQLTSASGANKSSRLFSAGRELLAHLETGSALGRGALREAMSRAHNGDRKGQQWSWRDAYEAGEVAVVLLLQRYGRPLVKQAGRAGRRANAELLRAVRQIAALEPSQTHRTEEQVRLQQFSTPLELALCVAAAADVQSDDTLFEPSAGCGVLAAIAAWRLNTGRQGRIELNEIGETRAGLLERLFPQVRVTREDAERISDSRHDAAPTVVVMNPPFSRAATLHRIQRDTDVKHIASAYRMLAQGGRLVAICSEGARPGEDDWQRAFARIEPAPMVWLSIGVSGRFYARHGTTAECRLTVIDKPRPEDPANEGGSISNERIETGERLLDEIAAQVPPRKAAGAGRKTWEQRSAGARKAFQANKRKQGQEPTQTHNWGPVQALKYEPIDRSEGETGGRDDDRSYELWRSRTVKVRGVGTHPTTLIESKAMAAVRHPQPSYRPMLPLRVTDEDHLSEAQIESVIIAGEAMEQFLPATYAVSEDWAHTVRVNPAGAPIEAQIRTDGKTPYDTRFRSAPVRFRQGWMLGDGTGCGKGRQVAAVILDQWLRGRRKAIWLSQSDKLVEDARRDWAAVGGHGNDVIALTKIRQGVPIPMGQGILFTTYATLRSAGRQEKISRLEQIIDWLAGSTDEAECNAFDGVIVFDESHAMANAAGGVGPRGAVAPSQQGLAGLKLQNALPAARVVYVSATGASKIEGLAYARRLGLWSTDKMPFESREEFVLAMNKGGVAALEIVARDLKALGLYQARALSFDGVEIEIVEHELSDEQIEIYNEYARAFQVIHSHIEAALFETCISDEEGVLNAAAKAAARSSFENVKQRFFGHLLTGMKVPTLLRTMERDLAEGRAPIVQLVSTGEALLERRIAEIPSSEWNNLSIDLTPREYVLDYLRRSFPVAAYREYEDEEGKRRSELMLDEDGNRIESAEAVARRDELIEKLAMLPPVQGGLDQLMQHFGHERMAEVTGRTRRVLRMEVDGEERFVLRSRSLSANISDVIAFMEGEKEALTFSGAGNTGRSYHADKGCRNQKRRTHNLLEAGWRADQAIQGLGRSHRTHQASAPIFRPVTTNVRGERRFISTIARRLDALGAITRGQRDSQTAMGESKDQTLFKAEDNLESEYAHAALRQFFYALAAGAIEGQTIEAFEDRTGLALRNSEKALKDDLPPMHTFLNRMLALEIHDQNSLFKELEERIKANIESAIEAGTFAQGVEQIRADEIHVVSEQTVRVDEDHGAETRIVKLMRRDRNKPTTVAQGLALLEYESQWNRSAELVINERSGRAAVVTSAMSWMDEATGAIIKRVRLTRPGGDSTMAHAERMRGNWQTTSRNRWERAWAAEIAEMPEFAERHVYLATGLLLPIWKKLPEESMKVWRLRTNDGRELIGRLLSPTQARRVTEQLGSNAGIEVEPGELYHDLLNGQTTRCNLGEGLRLEGRTVMQNRRLEIAGAKPSQLTTLKRLGCRTDLIAYKTRIIVPDTDTLRAVVDRYPPEANGGRAAA